MKKTVSVILNLSLYFEIKTANTCQTVTDKHASQSGFWTTYSKRKCLIFDLKSSDTF